MATLTLKFTVTRSMGTNDTEEYEAEIEMPFKGLIDVDTRPILKMAMEKTIQEIGKVTEIRKVTYL